MKIFTIFGKPVVHSKSPLMHNSAFQHLKSNSCYTKHYLENDNTLKYNLLKSKYNGANITVPYKEEAYRCCDILSHEAKIIGAVNTIVVKDNKLYGYNTDAPGFLKSIEEFKEIKNILILGAGGSAKAIAVILNNNNYNIEVVNRSAKKLSFFKNLNIKSSTWDNFTNRDFDMIINTTSAGLIDNNYPIDKNILEELFQNTKIAIDIIYGKKTPFLTLAKQYSLDIKDGEDMLLYQGVLAFELFTGIKADTNLIEAMREGLKS